jgi:hypothetical protein
MAITPISTVVVPTKQADETVVEHIPNFFGLKKKYASGTVLEYKCQIFQFEFLLNRRCRHWSLQGLEKEKIAAVVIIKPWQDNRGRKNGEDVVSGHSFYLI